LLQATEVPQNIVEYLASDGMEAALDTYVLHSTMYMLLREIMYIFVSIHPQKKPTQPMLTLFNKVSDQIHSETGIGVVLISFIRNVKTYKGAEYQKLIAAVPPTENVHNLYLQLGKIFDEWLTTSNVISKQLLLQRIVDVINDKNSLTAQFSGTLPYELATMTNVLFELPNAGSIAGGARQHMRRGPAKMNKGQRKRKTTHQ
jgi:hypothetical protein